MRVEVRWDARTRWLWLLAVAIAALLATVEVWRSTPQRPVPRSSAGSGREDPSRDIDLAEFDVVWDPSADPGNIDEVRSE